MNIPVRERLQEIAKAVDDRLPVGTGFIVLAFPFGSSTNERRIEYISNGKREDVLLAMKEFIHKNENTQNWMKHS